MIKMVRVDYRLLHGQVAVSWTATLGADALLLVSDTLKNDKIRLEALKLAKPSGVKVVVKTTDEAIEILKSGATDKYKLFIICETVQIADKIAEAFDIRSVNIGNIAFSVGKKKLANNIYTTDEEEAALKHMIEQNRDVFVQKVPSEKKVDVKKLI